MERNRDLVVFFCRSLGKWTDLNVHLPQIQSRSWSWRCDPEDPEASACYRECFCSDGRCFLCFCPEQTFFREFSDRDSAGQSNIRTTLLQLYRPLKASERPWTHLAGRQGRFLHSRLAQGSPKTRIKEARRSRGGGVELSRRKASVINKHKTIK